MITAREIRIADVVSPQASRTRRSCLYYPHMLTGEVHRVPVDGGPAELVAEQVHAPVAVRSTALTHRLPGVPRPFAGLAVADGALLLAVAGGLLTLDRLYSHQESS